MAFNIRQKQTDAVLRMLELHGASAKDGLGAAPPPDLYKVLVLDRFCRDVIAPLLRVAELRRRGITLHLALEAERQPIPDVPAVYFAKPTPDNVARIGEDLTKGLYERSYLSFATGVTGRSLETLAAAALRAPGGAARVGKVWDEYLAFLALEPNLFSLGLPQAYQDLNDPGAKDTQIEACVSAIVDGLFSVLVTLGVVPIIRCPKGGAAEAVAAALESKLRDHLKARSNLFNEGASALAATLSRPLLVVLDRNFDLASMLQHAWSYKPLVQDVLGLRLNRVTIAPEPSAAAGPGGAAAAAVAAQKQSYDVDDKDFFWEQCGALPFPKVAEEVEAQLQKYKAAVDEINAKTAAGAGADADVVDHDEVLRRNTQNLMNAVSSLPELQERKKVLDKHTNLATALLQAIKVRGIDSLYNLEEELLTGKVDVGTVVKAVQGQKGSAADRLRLALVAVLAADTAPSEAAMRELCDALEATGADTTALQYVARLRKNHLVGGRPAAGPGGKTVFEGVTAHLGVGGSNQSNLLDWADRTLGQGLQTVTRGVKNLLIGARQAPVAAALEALMDGKVGTPEYDTFAVLDPKLPPGRAGLDRAKGPFREAIVFMVGGGSYLEREALVAWAARAAGGAGGIGGAGGAGAGAVTRQVLYGATELLSGGEFLAQLEGLGRRSGIVGRPPPPTPGVGAAG